MNILGIANAETSSAALFVDGTLVAAASEERFTRVKMDEAFPVQAIDYVLAQAGLTKKDVDVVAYAWSKGFPEDALAAQMARYAELETDNEKAIFMERLTVEQERDFPKRQEFWDYVAGEPDFADAKVEDFYHHEAHALSAAVMSPYDQCAVLTCDGRGDYEALTFYVYDRARGSLEKLYSANSCDSIGFFYGRITGLLGFKPCPHEGKITGLAAYGDPGVAKGLMQKMIRFDGEHIRAKLGDHYRPFYSNYSDTLEQEIASYSREDIAAAAQEHAEIVLADFVAHQYDKHGLAGLPICLAGGVFGNVKINARLRDLDGVSGLYVQPQMGDGGLAVGAACGSLHTRNIKPALCKNMYLGPDGGDINSIISKAEADGFTCEKLDADNMIQTMIAGLGEDKVVGLVRGRMEFGPRALCNRSIIYRTNDTSCNDWLNKRMSRTEFMPFAPVMTVENAAEYIDGFSADDMSLWFMTATVDVADSFKDKSPAVTHVDQTARPQVVSKDRDAWLWQLLTDWEAASGEPSLINTSFNRHEEPIVCTYEEAYTNLTNGVVDMLVLDDYLISKA